MRKFVRALIVLHRNFHPLPLRARLHALVRFLTCPFLPLVRRVPRGASLLDIGAGHGLFAVLARDGGARRVVAVEPDLRKVSPLPGIEFVIGFDTSVGGTFDAISIVDVLYKIPTDQWDALLLRAAERLAPGGLLLVKEQDPTHRLKNRWNAMQEELVARIGLTLGEAFSYEPPDQFVARLKRDGFRDVTVDPIGAWYPHAHVLYVARK